MGRRFALLFPCPPHEMYDQHSVVYRAFVFDNALAPTRIVCVAQPHCKHVELIALSFRCLSLLYVIFRYSGKMYQNYYTTRYCSTQNTVQCEGFGDTVNG